MAQDSSQCKDRYSSIILCGGLSTRMGQPKALLRIGDETFLQRIVRINREVFDLVCVVAAKDQELPPLPPEVEIVRDSSPNRGPLQGIYDGMVHLKDRADAAFVCACDMPLLTVDVIRFIVAQLGNHEIAVPEVNGQPQPLAAVYRMTLVPLIRELLPRPDAGPTSLLGQVRTVRISAGVSGAAGHETSALDNINTEQERQRLLGKQAPRSSP